MKSYFLMDIRCELIELMSNRFYENFSAIASAKVLEMGAVDVLYQLATDNSLQLPKSKKQAVLFRSAYTLEYIYFNHRELFTPFIERFCSDFSSCKSESAKRHFAKMMSDILKYHTPTTEQMESIAETVACWISDPKTKVAVKIWAMSILKSLRNKVEWIDDIWNDLENVVTQNATPGILLRLKRGWE